MVNGGFPRPPPYGFELVDAPGAHPFRQWNIYGESSGANSRRFFDELSPLQSLALYRQWLGENPWRTTVRAGL
jgi:hypothetical protein